MCIYKYISEYFYICKIQKVRRCFVFLVLPRVLKPVLFWKKEKQKFHLHSSKMCCNISDNVSETEIILLKCFSCRLRRSPVLPTDCVHKILSER